MCRAGGYECVYQILVPQQLSAHSTSPPLEGQTDLSRRLELLEERLHRVTHVEDRLLRYEQQIRAGRSQPAPQLTALTSLTGSMYHSGDLAEVSLDASEIEQNEMPVNAMVAFADEQISGYFGRCYAKYPVKKPVDVA